MALPRAIQAQLDQANATLEALNRPPEPPPNPEAVAQPAFNLAPDPAAAPAPMVASEPPAAPNPPQTDVWEHKYKTLQGLFNREVPGLQTQVKDLKSQLDEAVTRLSRAAEEKARPSEPPAPPADPSDVENFGVDLVEMVQRVAERLFGRAAHELQTKAASLEQRLAQLEQALQGTNQTMAMTAEQSFFDRLTKLVPDWESTNAQQAFLAWLAEVDPMLDQPRQSALDAAQQTLNVERAAAVFRTFTSTQPASRSNKLDKQISPKGAASAPPAPAPSAVIYTEKQVVSYYDAKRRGEYRGKEDETQRIEAEINLAISEGRVR